MTPDAVRLTPSQHKILAALHDDGGILILLGRERRSGRALAGKGLAEITREGEWVMFIRITKTGAFLMQTKGAKAWAAPALEQMRRTNAPARLVADLKAPIFKGTGEEIRPGDVLELAPITNQESAYQDGNDGWQVTLVLVRWLDGHLRIAYVTHRKGPHMIGGRLLFNDSRGRRAWIGSKDQLAVVRKVES